MFKFLRYVARIVVRFFVRLQRNNPASPYEAIAFGAVYTAHDQFKGIR